MSDRNYALEYRQRLQRRQQAEERAREIELARGALSKEPLP